MMDAEEVRPAIELAESRYCGAGVMLGKTARLAHPFRSLDDDESESGVQVTGSTPVAGGAR
jgi:hypothetical protein